MLQLLLTTLKPKLENSHFSDYAQSLRDDLTRRTVTSVHRSPPSVFLYIMTHAGQLLH